MQVSHWTSSWELIRPYLQVNTPLDHLFKMFDSFCSIGMEGCDYHTILARDIDTIPRYLATGTPTCMAANRLSYFFNLSGPSLAVDTACSSSMAALHQAVRTLQHGDTGMALVCSAKLVLNPDMFMPSSELGFLSPSGKCQSFDAAADGYGKGEGVLALLLKPLKQAMEDRDPIRAVINGTRLNQDGRTQGITLPSADAQRNNMKALYEELGISPGDIQYLEAHVRFPSLLYRPQSLSPKKKYETGYWYCGRGPNRVLCGSGSTWPFTTATLPLDSGLSQE